MDTMLRIPLDGGQTLTIPTCMTEEDFQLIVATLILWKAKLIEKDVARRSIVPAVNAAWAAPKVLHPSPTSAPPRDVDFAKTFRVDVTLEEFEREVSLGPARLSRYAMRLNCSIGHLQQLTTDPRCRLEMYGRGYWRVRGGNGEVSLAEARSAAVVPSAPKIEREPEASPAGEDDNRKANPTDPVAIKVGRTLVDPWTATDLAARLDGDRTRVYYWLSIWKRKGWIETVGFEQYRKTASFGG